MFNLAASLRGDLLIVDDPQNNFNTQEGKTLIFAVFDGKPRTTQGAGGQVLDVVLMFVTNKELLGVEGVPARSRLLHMPLQGAAPSAAFQQLAEMSQAHAVLPGVEQALPALLHIAHKADINLSHTSLVSSFNGILGVMRQAHNCAVLGTALLELLAAVTPEASRGATNERARDYLLTTWATEVASRSPRATLMTMVISLAGLIIVPPCAQPVNALQAAGGRLLSRRADAGALVVFHMPSLIKRARDFELATINSEEPTAWVSEIP